MPAEEIRNFWEQTRAALAEVKMDAAVEPVEQSDVFTMEGRIKTRTIHRVIMSSFEGRRVRAWYTVPSGQPPVRGWPAIPAGTGDRARHQAGLPRHWPPWPTLTR